MKIISMLFLTSFTASCCTDTLLGPVAGDRICEAKPEVVEFLKCVKISMILLSSDTVSVVICKK